MFGVPTEIPVTTPVVATTEPCAGLLLLQVPPLTASVNAIDEPIQTRAGPDIAAGVEFTVIG